jgi:hypothetical protein
MVSLLACCLFTHAITLDQNQITKLTTLIINPNGNHNKNKLFCVFYYCGNKYPKQCVTSINYNGSTFAHINVDNLV